MRRIKINGIDVGTTKVCSIMATMDERDENNNLRIVGVGVAPSHGLEKALVTNVKEAKESIRQSVRRAEQMAGYKMESAYVGVTGRHINSVNNNGTVAITRNGQLVRSDDLKRAFKVAWSVKVPSERQLLHVIPRSFVVDGQEVNNPVGMHGFALNVEAHVVTCAITSVQNLTKCIMGIGIDINDLILEPLASAAAVLTEEEKQSGVMLADIGGGTTDIAVFKDGSIYHTSVLPVAGRQVSQDIATGLGLSFDLAEEMKKKYATVMPTDEKSDGDITIGENGHSVSSTELCNIVYARIEELLRLIVLELPRSDYTKFIPAGLVLTGGTANLPGIAELGQEIIRLPVRIGNPIERYGVSDVLSDPAYATSIGLLHWKTQNPSTMRAAPIRKQGLPHILDQVFRFFR